MTLLLALYSRLIVVCVSVYVYFVYMPRIPVSAVFYCTKRVAMAAATPAKPALEKKNTSLARYILCRLINFLAGDCRHLASKFCLGEIVSLSHPGEWKGGTKSACWIRFNQDKIVAYLLSILHMDRLLHYKKIHGLIHPTLCLLRATTLDSVKKKIICLQRCLLISGPTLHSKS